MADEPKKLKRDESAVPRGAFKRTSRLARSGIKGGFRVAMIGPRTLLGRDSPQKLAEDAAVATATELLKTLGGLKGLSMKAGQMASFVDAGVLPEELRDAYQEILGGLRDAAPPMKPELVEQVFDREFGAAPSTLYSEWNPEAVAAASLGQVHFARLTDGREVAVKVQYPGVDEAVKSDLSVTSLVRPLLPLIMPGLDADTALEEMKRMVLAELDYRGEAANLRELSGLYAGHPFIGVPAPVDELTTTRVLTLERASGIGFEETKRLPQDQKDDFAEKLFRFYYGALNRFGVSSADPHPGNSLYDTATGKVWVFDLGLVTRLTLTERAEYQRAFIALRESDPGSFHASMAAAGFMKNPAAIDAGELFEYVSATLEPIIADAPYTVTRDFIASITAAMAPGNRWFNFARHLNQPRHAISRQRLDLGVFAVLAQLNATANWHRIVGETMGMYEPATPLGVSEAEWLTKRS